MARSRPYRSQILQVNTSWKALAEIYTMHSFTPFWNPLHGSLSSKFCLKIAENIAKCLPIFRKRSIFVEVIRVLLVVLRRGFTGHSFCFRRTGIATGSSIFIWDKVRVYCSCYSSDLEMIARDTLSTEFALHGVHISSTNIMTCVMFYRGFEDTKERCASKHALKAFLPFVKGV